jgi:hypothetical protein
MKLALSTVRKTVPLYLELGTASRIEAFLVFKEPVFSGIASYLESVQSNIFAYNTAWSLLGFVTSALPTYVTVALRRNLA